MNSNRRWIQSFLGAGLAALLALSAASSRAGETITYIHWDALGSPVAATDESGNVVWRESYRPYGQRINNEAAAAPNSRWYTGHPQDPDTGLICAGARYYDPVVGRFLAVDRVGVQEGNIQSFNRYAYGNNNPYRYVDPDGKNGTEAIGGLFYESGQFLTGHGFDGARVWGALLDGYNGEGVGFAHAAFEDATTFIPAGAIGGLAIKAVRLARIAKIGNASVKGVDDFVQGYRAVSKSEVDDIATHGFRPSPGGRSMSDKWFYETREGAEKFSKNYSDLDEIVEVKVPRDVYDRSYKHPNMDNGGPAFCVPCDDLSGLMLQQ